MKVLIDNKVYVQKIDMAYLTHSGLDIPASIFLQVFGQGITIIDNSNRYEFIEFSNPEEIKFFKGLDWIVDYNEVKDLTEEELLMLGQNIVDDKNDKIDQFNAMPEDVRRRQYDKVTRGLELMDFKINTIRDIIMLKRGELSFPFPQGVEVAQTLIAEIIDEKVESNKSPKREGGIKRFVKSLFGPRSDK